MNGVSLSIILTTACGPGCCLVSKSCPTLRDLMDCSPPGSSVHGSLAPQPEPFCNTKPLLLECLLKELIHQGKTLFSSVQSLSHVRLFVTLWTAALQVSLSITNSQSLLKLLSIEPVMPSNHLIFCHPLLLPPSIFPSIRVFSHESVFPIRWPKY